MPPQTYDEFEEKVGHLAAAGCAVSRLVLALIEENAGLRRQLADARQRNAHDDLERPRPEGAD